MDWILIHAYVAEEHLRMRERVMMSSFSRELHWIIIHAYPHACAVSNARGSGDNLIWLGQKIHGIIIHAYADVSVLECSMSAFTEQSASSLCT